VESSGDQSNGKRKPLERSRRGAFPQRARGEGAPVSGWGENEKRGAVCVNCGTLLTEGQMDCPGEKDP